jgi:6-phospho-beta-glucosidase
MIERITILGGSSVYTPEFIQSAISRNLNIKEFVLVGREGGKLPVVGRFCQRLLDKNGFPATVTWTTDIAEGVRSAKYILNGIRVGGMPARIRDEKVPPRFGMIGDESLGAGGFANALRTLPVVFDLARQIEQANPDAVFINLTNPMGILVEALTRYSKLKVIGTCDLPGSCVKKVAEVLHCAPSELWVDYIGLNHMGWIQDVRVDGRSCMGPLLERIERHKEDGFDLALIELFRMIPTRTVGLFFNQAEILREQHICSRFRAEDLHEAEEQILKLYQDEHLCDVPELTRQRNAVWYEETIVPLIEALESRGEHHTILCVRNGKSVRDLPEEASVEVPVTVSRKGFKPHAVGNSPAFLKGLFIAIKESDRLAIEAARHKSYEFALQSLTINPLVPSLQTAKRFLDYLVKEENLEIH